MGSSEDVKHTSKHEKYGSNIAICNAQHKTIEPSLEQKPSASDSNCYCLFIVALVVIEAAYPSCASYSLGELIGSAVLRLPYFEQRGYGRWYRRRRW
jgi:hypothetical protein